MTLIKKKLESKQGFLTENDAIKHAKNNNIITDKSEIHILKYKYTKLDTSYESTVSSHYETPSHMYGYEVWEVYEK